LGGPIDVIGGTRRARAARHPIGPQNTTRCPALKRRSATTVSVRRIIARDGGIRHSRPTTSVMKPGVNSSAPPKITIAPSNTSRWGTRRSPSAWLKRRHAVRPWARSSSAPSTLSTKSNAIVGPAPIHCPTLMITYSSASGTTMNATTRNSMATA
jgi:hypothetical protein